MDIFSLFRQLSILLGLPAVVLAGLAAAVIVIAHDWRLAVFSYALLSALLGVLLSRILPTEWAILQVIVGVLIALMLAVTAWQLRGQMSGPASSLTRWPQLDSLTSFRLLTVTLTLVVFFVVRNNVSFPAVQPLLKDAILWLGMLGLLGLALHEEPLHAGLALLTFLGASLLLLFSLMQRRMLVGLIEAGQLMLGLAISYLMLSQGLARSQPLADADTPESLP
jgi:hypothetical protein